MGIAAPLLSKVDINAIMGAVVLHRAYKQKRRKKIFLFDNIKKYRTFQTFVSNHRYMMIGIGGEQHLPFANFNIAYKKIKFRRARLAIHTCIIYCI